MPLSLSAHARAHWVARSLLLWPAAPSAAAHHIFSLHADPDAKLEVTAAGLLGGRAYPLTPAPAGLPAALREKFPHLADLPALSLPEAAAAQAPDLLRGQVVVAERDRAGRLVEVTGVQIPGVLDELYPYAGPLGICLLYTSPSPRD